MKTAQKKVSAVTIGTSGVSRDYSVRLLLRSRMKEYLDAIGLIEGTDYSEQDNFLNSTFTVVAHASTHRVLRKQIHLWGLYPEKKHVVVRFREFDYENIIELAREHAEKFMQFPESKKQNKLNLVFESTEHFETFKSELKGTRHRFKEI